MADSQQKETDVDRLSAALKSQTAQTWRESERADKADHMRVAIETGKVHPALAIDLNEHRQQAYQGGWNDGYAEGFAKAADGTATLKRELAARAIRTMGPRSPFWNCTICGASQQTPIEFRHKAECLLADAPYPPALTSSAHHKAFYSIELQHAEMIAALRDIEFICDGKEDADDGMPNDAMKIMAVVQTMLRKVAE